MSKKIRTFAAEMQLTASFRDKKVAKTKLWLTHNPNFKVVEFDHFRMQAGLPNFVLSVSENVESKHILKG